MDKIPVTIGLDDIDAPNAGCTTHLASLIALKLLREGYEFTDFLNLVRLNPAVPWKTRGNGAVALRLLVEVSKLETINNLVINEVDRYVEKYKNPKHQPSVVILRGEVPEEVRKMGLKALWDIVPRSYVRDVIAKIRDNLVIHPDSERRGVIGALAAIGNNLRQVDHTFELILYRAEENLGKPRMVDPSSIWEMDQYTRGETLLNIDYETKRPLITPRGGDPILLGIRGESPLSLAKAVRFLRIMEPVTLVALFRTNQHTDPHVKRLKSVCEIRPYMCVSVSGMVSSRPVRIVGGHVIFKLCDGSCCIDVAAYEPTKHLRDIVSDLHPGDLVEVIGCARPPSSTHGPTLNLEKIRVVELVELKLYENPICPQCGRRMTSAGRGKGFKCTHCGYRSQSLTKITRIVQRRLVPGWYEPPPSAFKHVMKPLSRYGREKAGDHKPPVFIVSEKIDDFLKAVEAL